MDIIGDAQALPIRSSSFDAVVATDVLMYVSDAPRAAAEMVRVLKPGGILFAAEPFLYPDMGSGTTRFTHRGLAALFTSCRVLHSGYQRGAGSAVLPLIAYYVGLLLSFNSFFLYRAVTRVMLVLLFPLAYVDRVLMRFDRVPQRLYTNCVAYCQKPER